MQIIEASFQVIFITASMFPEPTLPDSSLSFAMPAFGDGFFCCRMFSPASREYAFYTPNAHGVIVVSTW